MKSQVNKIGDNSNAVTNAPQPNGRNEPSAGGAAVNDRSGVEDSSGSAVHQWVTLYCSSFLDDLTKEKLDKRLSLISSTDSGVPFCRICFQGPEKGELLSPCLCRGSVQHSHQACLIMWIRQRGSWRCELCNCKYKVITISTKNPLQWKAIPVNKIEKVQLATFLISLVFILFSTCWFIWFFQSPFVKFQQQRVLFQNCLILNCVLDVVSIGMIIHGSPLVCRIFNRWQIANSHWKVLTCDKTKDWH